MVMDSNGKGALRNDSDRKKMLDKEKVDKRGVGKTKEGTFDSSLARAIDNEQKLIESASQLLEAVTRARITKSG